MRKTELAEVVRHKGKLLVPTDMSLETAIEVLQRKLQEEEQVVELRANIPGFIVMAGEVPATVRECVERAKWVAIGRSLPGEDLRIDAESLYQAAVSVRNEQDYIRRSSGGPTVTPDGVEKLGCALGKFVREGVALAGLSHNGNGGGEGGIRPGVRSRSMRSGA